MFVVLIVACSLGAYSLGRDAGRRDAQPQIDRLNDECADLMDRAYRGGSTSVVWFALSGETPPPSRSYDFRSPKDREDYRKHFPDPFNR
jgi:hypothetical protein